MNSTFADQEVTMDLWRCLSVQGHLMPIRWCKVLQLQKEGFVCNYRSISTNNNKSGYTVYYGFEFKWRETHQIGL
jgi:hypothetical protein